VYGALAAPALELDAAFDPARQQAPAQATAIARLGGVGARIGAFGGEELAHGWLA
jgi:hypothetical protein